MLSRRPSYRPRLRLEQLEDRLVLSQGALSATALPITGQEGDEQSNVLATFTDSDPTATAADFTVSVAWGDDTTTQEKVGPGPSGGFVVQGSFQHEYHEDGSYTFTVTISAKDGGQATAMGTATISEARLSVYIEPSDFTLSEYGSFGLNLGHIYHNFETDATFDSLIDWGDGTSSPGEFMSGGNWIQGTHAYTDEGNYFVQVTVWETEHPSITATDSTLLKVMEESFPNGAVGEPNVRFLQEAYHDLLGRGVDSAGLESFSHQLDLGMSRFQEALALVSSAEYLTHQVDAAFHHYVQRLPTAGEEEQAVQFLTGGGTVEALTAQLAGTVEYFDQAGGTLDDFLNTFYHDALGRGVDPAGRAAFDQAAAAGATRADVALAILSGDEYKGDLVEGLYQQLLDRAPLPAEQAAWVAFLDQPGGRDETATAGLTASDEFYSKPDVLTPSPQTLYLFRVYTDLLGRYPDSTEQIHYRQLLDTGESRLQIVMDIQATAEYRTRRLNALYQQYLQRDADPAGLDSGMRYLADGGSVEHLAALIVGSPEFLQKAGGTFDGLLDALYRDTLGRTVDLAGRAAFDQAAAAGMTPTDIAWVILNSDEYQAFVIQAVYSRLLHRAVTPVEQSGWIVYLGQSERSESVLAAIAASDEYFGKTNG